ncbi:glutamic acid-rich protein-like [Morus notabilis]|uniref:glutamic acid-rich protein-like n=1 Tax=Morus notabilis TaxID=981085 RepID=UPI000CED366D|nr:glutamic acid-rich protein-like [Morus notabilis]
MFWTVMLLHIQLRSSFVFCHNQKRQYFSMQIHMYFVLTHISAVQNNDFCASKRLFDLSLKLKSEISRSKHSSKTSSRLKTMVPVSYAEKRAEGEIFMKEVTEKFSQKKQSKQEREEEEDDEEEDEEEEEEEDSDEPSKNEKRQ